jgi:hypothetical protein
MNNNRATRAERSGEGQLELVSLPTLAARIEYNPETLRRACRAGRIPAVKCGREWRVTRPVFDYIIKYGIPLEGIPVQVTEMTTVTEADEATILQPLAAQKAQKAKRKDAQTTDSKQVSASAVGNGLDAGIGCLLIIHPRGKAGIYVPFSRKSNRDSCRRTRNNHDNRPLELPYCYHSPPPVRNSHRKSSNCVPGSSATPPSFSKPGRLFRGHGFLYRSAPWSL